MEVERTTRRRWPVAVLLCSWALAVVGGLASVVVYATRRAAAGPEPYRPYLLWLALVAVVLLAMTLIVWVWMLAHRVSARWREAKRRPGAKYVNAWRLAGKRFRLEGQDQEPDEPADPGR